MVDGGDKQQQHWFEREEKEVWEPYASSVESGDDDEHDTGAHVDGDVAAAANGDPDPPAPPVLGAFWHGPSVGAPSLDGHEFSRKSDDRHAVWAAGSGGHGGGAASPVAPVAAAPPGRVYPDTVGLADNLHGASLHTGPEQGAPGFRREQQQQQQRHFLPFRGHGADMAGCSFSDGRFSPPEGEAAPFRNWPVADGDRHANLLVEYDMGDMNGPNSLNHSSNGYTHHNDPSGNDGAAAGAAAAAAAPARRFR
eukprot:g13872.t1